MGRGKSYSDAEREIIDRLQRQGRNVSEISIALSSLGFNRNNRKISQYLYDQKLRRDREKVRPIPKETSNTAGTQPSARDAKLKEYVLTRLETMHNKMQIAREIKRAFHLPESVEEVRDMVRALAEQAVVELKNEPVRRLFWDIETSFCIGWFWRPAYKTNIGPHQIIEHTKIICIAYKWQHEDGVHTLVWDEDQDDRELLQEFVRVLGKADEVVAHNGDKFDLKVFRTRCIKQEVLVFPKYRTFDTLKKARKYFAFPSNRLDELGAFLGVGRKMDTGGHELWEDVVLHKDSVALEKMLQYCMQDVILLEDVFTRLNPYVDHNTNHAVQRRLDKWHCPNCASEEIALSHTDTTPMGYIKRHMKCLKCKKFFHVSNRTYLRWIKSNEKDPDDLK